jgi:hypothetical protein
MGVSGVTSSRKENCISNTSETSKVIDEIRNSIILMELNGSQSFTGFLMKINQKNYLLTCNHFIKEEDIESKSIVTISLENIAEKR